MGGKKIVLVTGGTRSGKSEFAEDLALRMGGPVTYLATLAPGDEEMQRRVDLHRERRPARWTTIEEAVEIPGRLDEAGRAPGVLLVDCLTGWLSNLLLSDTLPHPGADRNQKEEYIDRMVEELAGAAGRSAASVIIVADEVGLGLVPPYPLGRLFRDIAGKAGRRLALTADEVYLVVAGLAVEIKKLAVNVEK
ncbi:MAG: bifunctional adenosylcobinamide kinase/adenosylcobinamide-phosphate guanylyltransferase [Actinobacteria bacterium]|nr:bifunctional adenosylcobinamide kinase/adenosylcobinamide-phosphate guanylyltransferase [Actinomycetota bacterium]